MSKTPEQMEKEHYMRLKKQLPHAPEEQVRKLAQEAVEAKIKMPLLDTSAQTANELFAWCAYENK